MQFFTRTVERSGEWVTEHETMDGLRRKQCLCLNCKLLEVPTTDCAKAISYALCRTFNVAFAMTRCPKFEQKEVADAKASGD